MKNETLTQRLEQYYNILENSSSKRTIKIARESLIQDAVKYKNEIKKTKLEKNEKYLQGILDSFKYEMQKDSKLINFLYRTKIKKFNEKYSGALLTFNKEFQGKGFTFSGTKAGENAEFSGTEAGINAKFSGYSAGINTKFSGYSAGENAKFSGDRAGENAN